MQLITVFKKEFYSFFLSNLAYFVAGAYLVLSMLTTFYLGYFFTLENQGLSSFFFFQPDIMVILIPALTMRMWAEEAKSGTLEFLLTQPISYLTLVIAKFLSVWAFCLLLFLLTFPFWIYASFLASLDQLQIFSSYLGCFLAAGAIAALGCAVSAFNRSPIVAYIVTVFICWGFVVGNFDFLLGMFHSAGEVFLQMIQSLNFSYHFQNFASGLIGVGDLFYFFSAIVLALYLNVFVVTHKKN